MAFAFYIPDQAKLLRRAKRQEQRILERREAYWRYVASVAFDVLRQYLEATSSSRNRSRTSNKVKRTKN